MSNIIGHLIVDADSKGLLILKGLIKTVYCNYRSDSSTEALVALAEITQESWVKEDFTEKL